MQNDSMGIKKKKRTGLKIFLGIVLVLVAVCVGSFVWYSVQLRPVDSNDDVKQWFDISEGVSTEDVAARLHGQGLIRNPFAYRIYIKLNGSTIQAGAHLLSPSLSSQEVAEKLSTAETDEITVTIPPGLTLAELREIFKGYGYNDKEITDAYQKTYDSPLLADKPADADLEGYIFPETYNIYATDGLDVLLEKSFDELYRRLQADGSVAKFEASGLSVFQAITLASIVQQEVPEATDQKKVAGVFYNRLDNETWLGSDATFVFAAKKLGVDPSPTLDSPYNTRINKGLPPGPIANMNYSAIEAVADPIRSDYNYFVSGDDGTTHFAVTEADHIRNTALYCTTLCQ